MFRENQEKEVPSRKLTNATRRIKLSDKYQSYRHTRTYECGRKENLIFCRRYLRCNLNFINLPSIVTILCMLSEYQHFANKKINCVRQIFIHSTVILMTENPLCKCNTSTLLFIWVFITNEKYYNECAIYRCENGTSKYFLLMPRWLKWYLVALSNKHEIGFI